MSNAIDLTADADSPPRAPPRLLSLPTGRGRPSATADATATPEASISNYHRDPASRGRVSFLDLVMSQSEQSSAVGPSSQGGAGQGGSNSNSRSLRPAQPARRSDHTNTRPTGEPSRGGRPDPYARMSVDASITNRNGASRRRPPQSGRRGIESNRTATTAPSSSTAATASTGAATAAAPSPRLTARDLTDDGFELTGMSEGARQAAERARREAEESQRWRQDFLNANARSIPGSYGAGPSHGTRNQVANPSNTGHSGRNVPSTGSGVRLHDHLPPGPHQARTGALGMISRGMTGLLGDYLTDGGGTLNLHGLTDLLRAREQAAGRGGAIRGGSQHHRRVPAQLSLHLPSNHDFKMVLNHRDRQVRIGFSFGIVEPPVDVETYEDDPNIIAGALPDTSPICAGCDCALVLGGEGKQRMWALPCGHVVDGRCYERYCVGISADTARRMARAEVEADRQRAEEEESAARVEEEESATRAEEEDSKGKGRINLLKRNQPGDPNSSATEDEEDQIGVPLIKSTKVEEDAGFKGKHRAISPAPLSLAATTSTGEAGPSSSTMTLRRRGSQPEGEGSQTAFAHQAPKQVSVSKDSKNHNASHSDTAKEGSSKGSKTASSSTANTDAGRRVANFKCPVDGCQQRISTASGKPSSALALYI